MEWDQQLLRVNGMIRFLISQYLISQYSVSWYLKSESLLRYSSRLFHHQGLYLFHRGFHSFSTSIQEDHISFSKLRKILYGFCPHTEKDHIRIKICLLHLFGGFSHTAGDFLPE